MVSNNVRMKAFNRRTSDYLMRPQMRGALSVHPLKEAIVGRSTRSRQVRVELRERGEQRVVSVEYCRL